MKFQAPDTDTIEITGEVDADGDFRVKIDGATLFYLRASDGRIVRYRSPHLASCGFVLDSEGRVQFVQ